MMRRDHSPYPIGQVIIRTFQLSGLRVGDFVERCGYKNVDRGIVAFDSWIKTGHGSSFFLEQCSSVFQIPKADLARALDETKAILDAERKVREAKEEEERQREAERIDRESRLSFRPFIEAQPEHREPSSYTFYRLTGGRQRLQRPVGVSVEEARSEEALERVRQKIVAHMLQTEGRSILQGRIIGYWYFFDYDQLPLRFSTDGVYIAQCTHEIEVPPSVTVYVGKRRLNSAFS